MIDTPTKPAPHFPSPEWTSVSAQMAAQLAHEIRNPLLSIKGAAQLLEKAVAAEDQSLAQLIIAEANRIDALVAQLDPLTPNPLQTPEPINIHEVTEYARQAASSFANNITIITDYDPSLPEVAGIREALIQVLINILKNAVDALTTTNIPSPLRGGVGRGATHTADTSPPHPDLPPQGGKEQPTITLSTRFLVGERMRRMGGERLPVAISITDNGPGVPLELEPRLFTPFTTTKESGKGLGLAIVAKIVEEHGGLIAHDRPLSGGARFTIYLPFYSA